MCSFVLFDLLGQVLEIFITICGIGDDVERLGPKAGDDSIVYNSTGDTVKKAGEGGVVGLYRGDIAGRDAF